MSEKTGIEKAREVAEKLKNEKAEKEAQAEQGKQIALSQLALVRENSELSKMYADSAQMGADNLGGSLPQLKVHAVGKSTTNELADGSEPDDGAFFYKPTQTQFKSISCHILTISKGFRSKSMNGKKEVFNQIMGGIIIETGEPFIMYVNGGKLSNLWDFGREAAKYTRSKSLPIPMFALTVNLTTERIKGSYIDESGKTQPTVNWIINFEVEKTEDGTPALVTDPGEFRYLKDHVVDIEEMIAHVIENKASEEEVVQPLKAVETHAEELNQDDIP